MMRVVLNKIMPATLEAYLAPIRSSPFLPEIADALRREVEAEKQLRARFYKEMTPSEKVEFIGGQVIMHSPARNGHLDVTLNILQLLATRFFRIRKGQLSRK